MMSLTLTALGWHTPAQQRALNLNPPLDRAA
jgi:hypothetical protein